MTTSLSEQLADLSLHAKKAEDRLGAAQNETHDMIMSSWEQARADVAADLDALQAKVLRKKHEFDARRAEREADRLEWNASVALDYAIVAVDQARVAVLAAIAGRIQAEDDRRAA